MLKVDQVGFQDTMRRQIEQMNQVSQARLSSIEKGSKGLQEQVTNLEKLVSANQEDMKNTLSHFLQDMRSMSRPQAPAEAPMYSAFMPPSAATVGAAMFQNSPMPEVPVDKAAILKDLGLQSLASMRNLNVNSTMAGKAASSQRMTTEQAAQPMSEEVKKESESELAQALKSIVITQQAMLESIRGGTGANILDSSDPALGAMGLGALKGARERNSFKNRLENESLSVAAEWWEAARIEAKVEEGFPFSAALYGERCLAPHFQGHKVLQRV